MDEMGRALADGRAIVEVVRKAAHHGQWAEAAARLEAWAEKLTIAVEILSAAEVPIYADGAIASIIRTVECARRMHAMAMDAANYAWTKAAAECGVRA